MAQGKPPPSPPAPVRSDDPNIGIDEVLLRLISPADVVYPGTPQERISSKAFNTKEISICAIKISHADATKIKPGWRIAELTKREVRALDCIVVLEPDPLLPPESHCGIYQELTGGKTDQLQIQPRGDCSLTAAGDCYGADGHFGAHADARTVRLNTSARLPPRAAHPRSAGVLLPPK